MSAAAEEPARVAVIGLGNVLLGDDAFGPFVIALLRAQWEFPACVELIDAGTPGLDLVTYLYDRDLAILIDTVRAGGKAGELRLYRGEELCQLPPGPRVSPHDPAVQETLAIAALSGHGPRTVLLVGAVPESTRLGVGLSAELSAAAPAAAAIIVRELATTSASPVARQPPEPVDAWWTRAAAARG